MNGLGQLVLSYNLDQVVGAVHDAYDNKPKL